jgi:hypothetical protein
MKKPATGLLKVLHLLLLLLVVSLPLQPVSADRGLITHPHASVEESGQTAIVAWNGQEEVLILSTDVKSAHATSVLEILPLPSLPTKVEEGSFDSFRKISDLINERYEATNYFHRGIDQTGEGGVEIVFHEEIGAHGITIVRVEDLDAFIEWVEGFAEEIEVELAVSPEFKDAVSNYLDREIRYFVFDVIEAKEATRSVNPLIYRFETDVLYYPLEITAASNISEQTYSQVNLFLVTKGVINSTRISSANFAPRSGFTHFIDVSVEELSEISPELADLFKDDPLVMNTYYQGPLSHLKDDLIIEEGALRAVTFAERLAQALVELPLVALLTYVSPHAFTLTPLLGQFVVTALLLSFLLGVPSAIFFIARRLTHRLENTSLGPHTTGLISYGVTIAASIFLLFSGSVGVMLLGVVTFTLIGIAAIIFMIRRVIKKKAPEVPR